MSFCSTSALARAADCSESTVRRARDRGLIRPTVVGGRDLYRDSDAQHFALYRAALKGARRGPQTFLNEVRAIEARTSPAWTLDDPSPLVRFTNEPQRF